MAVHYPLKTGFVERFPLGTRVVRRRSTGVFMYGTVVGKGHIRRHCDVKGIPMIITEGCFRSGVPTCHVMTMAGGFYRYAIQDLEECLDDEWILADVMEK